MSSGKDEKHSVEAVKEEPTMGYKVSTLGRTTSMLLAPRSFEQAVRVRLVLSTPCTQFKIIDTTTNLLWSRSILPRPSINALD